MLGEMIFERIFAVQFHDAWVAELVDALDSKSSSRKGVGVRFPSSVRQ